MSFSFSLSWRQNGRCNQMQAAPVRLPLQLYMCPNWHPRCPVLHLITPHVLPSTLLFPLSLLLPLPTRCDLNMAYGGPTKRVGRVSRTRVAWTNDVAWGEMSLERRIGDRTGWIMEEGRRPFFHPRDSVLCHARMYGTWFPTFQEVYD
jgi:hypothetical protein